MRKTLTLKFLNEKIAQPLGVELVKGQGYFYLVGDIFDNTFSTSVMVYKVNDLPFDMWEQEIKDMVAKAKKEV